ncbi:MAG: ferrochelatase [Flavobacteriales bacterium]|nr:MAG: ferrochelatase [Flavobacteriales bacterium]
MSKKGVLLINLGTPNSPSTKDVRIYLTEFLNDPYVIDINWLARTLLVNLIIVPFRAPKSAKIYKKLWTEKGSPLLCYSQKAQKKLQIELGDSYKVHLAMRYQNPSMDKVIAEMEKENYDEIIVIPLYPQYATSSTKTSIEKAKKLFKKWATPPIVKYVEHFYNHPLFIDTIIEQAKPFTLSDYDSILFSYHGLPTRQLHKTHPGKTCKELDCKNSINGTNRYCYQAQCYKTTRLIAEKLNLGEEDYSVGFQSRLDDKWLKPYSDKLVEQFAQKGKKNLLVFSPAFVADCLETIIEISDEYQEIFTNNGGNKLQLVPSLNDHPTWISTLKELVLAHK